MGIQVTPIPRLTVLTAPAFTLGTVNTAGSAITAVASNSTLLTYDTTVPTTIASADSAATGSAVVSSRRDHVHGAPAFAAAATQAEMESASSVTAFASPGRMKYNLGVFKACALIQFSGGTPSATFSQGVASLSDLGVGETRIYFDPDFSDTNIIALATTRQEEETSTSSMATTNQVGAANMDVVTYDSTDGSVMDETVMVVAYGDQ